jgi:hypothetical protein
MSKIKDMFPKFDVPIIFADLKDNAGQFWMKSDCIALDKELKRTLPGCAAIVLLHEMIHSTLVEKRLNRIARLQHCFGEYKQDSLAYKVEECIADIGSMIMAKKLGLFNEYSKTVILSSLEKYYTSDMYIPVRELRSAVKYFADDETSFEDEIGDTMVYLEAYLDIKFQDTYQQTA